MKMWSLVKYSGKIIISLLLSLMILAPVAILYDYKGVMVTCEDGSTEVKYLSNNIVINSIEGIGINTSDSNGYFNLDDESLSDDPVDILLMGSSHIEGLQVLQKDKISELLNEGIPDMRTYNIGVSGHTLPICVNNLQDAVNTYSPSSYVIIETDKICFDADILNAAVNEPNEIIERDKNSVAIKKFLKTYFPAVMALNTARTNWYKTEASSGKDAAIVSNPDAEYEEALDGFLKHASECMTPDCTLIIFYHPITELDFDGSVISDPVEEEYRRIFSEACARYGVVFIDMTQDFSDMYYQDHHLAHGFFNTTVGQGHLNAYGQRAVAQKLIDVIDNERG